MGFSRVYTRKAHVIYLIRCYETVYQKNLKCFLQNTQMFTDTLNHLYFRIIVYDSSCHHGTNIKIQHSNNCFLKVKNIYSERYPLGLQTILENIWPLMRYCGSRVRCVLTICSTSLLTQSMNAISNHKNHKMDTSLSGSGNDSDKLLVW